MTNGEQEVKNIMTRRRQVRSQIKNLKPSERPNPFKPAKSYYHDYVAMDANLISQIKCRNCISKGSPFTHLNDEQRSKVSANWQFSKRVDSNIQDMEKHCAHRTITDGYLKVTDSRFDTNLGSTFLAGEITHSSPLQQRLLMRNSIASKAKSFNGGGARASISSKFSTSMRGGRDSTNYSPSPDLNRSQFDNLMIGMKRPLVANLANVPTVKIASYSKRNPETLFYP